MTAAIAIRQTDPCPVDLPSRPSDLDGIGHLQPVLDSLYEHRARLAQARLGGDPPEPGDQLAARAIAALATGRAIASRMLAERWADARDALAHGATVEQVASAMALDVADVRTGLRHWVKAQERRHLDAGTLDDLDEPVPLAGAREHRAVRLATDQRTWLTTSQAAERIGRDPSNVRRLVGERRLHGHQRMDQAGRPQHRSRWTFASTAIDVFVQGGDEAAQRRACGCVQGASRGGGRR